MEKIIREIENMEIKIKDEKDILSAIANKLNEKDIDYSDRESLFNIQIQAQIALNYKGLKKLVSEMIERKDILIALNSNTNTAHINLKEKRS